VSPEHVTRLPRTVPVGQARRTLEAVRTFRANFIFGVLLLLFGGLLARFAHLQLVRGDDYRAQAEARQGARVTVTGVRGRIADVHGRLLATSAFGREVAVDADPSVLAAEDLPEYAGRIAALLDGEQTHEQILARLVEGRGRRRVVEGPFGLRWLRTGTRHLVLREYVDEPRIVAALDEAALAKDRIPGLKVGVVERRSYPNGDYAAHVVGLEPSCDGARPEGIDALLDERLDPARTCTTVLRDGRATWLADGPLLDAARLRGGEVRLTLDLVVQHHVERALDELAATWKPESAVALALDPATGAVLALACRPGYDPTPGSRRRTPTPNFALSGLFEPGSVFKPFTVAWALRNGMPPDVIVPMPLSVRFEGDAKAISDTHYIGDGPLTLLLSESSNTGAAWLSDRMGGEAMRAMLDWVGLGRRTGIEHPQEGAWTAWPRPLRRSDQLRAAFGHAICITPIRLAGAFAAFARADGRQVAPTLVPGRRADGGTGEPLAAPEHLALVREGLAGCVDTGTADDAFRGCAYAAAGKTGTAKVHLDTRHVCSFAGYAPRESPRLLVVVMAVTQRSQQGSGGRVAAPAARRILESSLPYLGVAPASPAEAP
jgi:cell division protein FtsI (penicillin-binding protein 3)